MSVCAHTVDSSADVELATQAGVSLVRAVQFGEYDALLIASADSAVIHCGKAWIEAGLPTYVVRARADSSRPAPSGYQVIFYDTLKREERPAAVPEFDPEVYSFCFETIPTNIDGLRVIKLPNLRDPIPLFLPVRLRPVRSASGRDLRLVASHSFIGIEMERVACTARTLSLAARVVVGMYDQLMGFVGARKSLKLMIVSLRRSTEMCP